MHCSLHTSGNTQTFSLTNGNHVNHCRCRWPEGSRRVHTPRCSTELVAPLSNVVLTQLDQLPAPAITAEVSTQHGEVSRVGCKLPQPQKPQSAPVQPQQPAAVALQPATPSATQPHPQAVSMEGMQQQQQQPQQLRQQVLQQAAVAGQPEQAAPPQLQQDKQRAQSNGKRSRKAKASAAAAAAAAAPQPNDSLQEPQQQPHKPARSHRRAHTRLPLKFKPCGRGASLSHAAAVSRHLSQGKQVLLPAGSGMQVARGVAALASARTLMLGYSSSTGLAFQPSFPAAAAAAVAAQVQAVQQDQRQQQQQQQHHYHQQQQQHGSRQEDGQRSGEAPGSPDSGIMMFVTGLPEAQLRRFEQSPLIAARYGNASLLAGAAFARVCQQGFTAVRAAGPDALAVALAAVTHARRKLLGCGLDLAVVPMTEFVDVDSLTGPDGQPLVYDDEQQQQQQLLEYGPGDEFGRSCVRVTVLHLMRCEPQQPWQLLPWPPAPEQQPAVQWQAEQLELQQHAWQQQQQQQAVVLQQRQQRRPAARKASVQQQSNGAVQQSSSAGSSAAVPASDGLARPSERASSSSSSVWPGPSAVEGVAEAVAAGQDADMVLQAGAYSHSQSVLARQGASVLLQKQRKNKRQLVAAAQSATHGSKGSCSSGSGSATSQ